MFDNENCLKIYTVLNDYKAGVIDAKAAKAKLDKLDMSKKGKFEKGFKKIVDEIYADDYKNHKANNIVK